MGGGPDKETLVFIFMFDEPKHITDDIRRKFPHIEVIYHQLGKAEKGKTMGGISYAFDTIPEELWHKATILVTLGSLPPKPELVPNLKYIHLLSAGIDHFVNHPILTDSDIPISTSSGIHGPAITEWILLTTLALHKNFALMHEHQKAHKWESDELGLRNSWDWEGKTIGIMGYGSIGRQAARVYSAMGSKIHAYTATPRSTPESRHNTSYQLPNTGDPDGIIPTAWYSGTDKPALHTFLSSGLDMLIISVPLTPSTRHIISDEELDVLYRASLEKGHSSPSTTSTEGNNNNKLPPHTGTILVNISRGPVLNTASLLRALHPSHISKECGRKLLGACLDVTDPEPLPPDHELWDCPDVVITPHIAALGREYLERSMGVLVENLGRRERGEGMVNLVGRGRGY